MEGRLFGMKTHLLGNVGKGPRQFHQGQAGLWFPGFLLSHGRMTTGASALFLLGRRVRTEGLWTQGDPSHLVDFGPSLFRGFLADELHDPCVIQRGWRVTGPRSAGLDVVQPRDPFFYGALFLFVPCLGWAGIQLSYLAGHPFHRTSTLRPLRFKTFSTRNNESSDTYTFCTSSS